MRIQTFDSKQASPRYVFALRSQLGALVDTFSDIDNAQRSLKKLCLDILIIRTHFLCEKHFALIKRYRKLGYRTRSLSRRLRFTSGPLRGAYISKAKNP